MGTLVGRCPPPGCLVSVGVQSVFACVNEQTGWEASTPTEPSGPSPGLTLSLGVMFMAGSGQNVGGPGAQGAWRTEDILLTHQALARRLTWVMSEFHPRYRKGVTPLLAFPEAEVINKVPPAGIPGRSWVSGPGTNTSSAYLT